MPQNECHMLPNEIPKQLAHEAGETAMLEPAIKVMLRTGMHAPHRNAWDLVLSPTVSLRSDLHRKESLPQILASRFRQTFTMR